ncbi:immunity-related GTPase family M protein 1-like isoform X1 [Zalophus californianus]|nr:immunity-related GTPase family M protein 1-like isoform X1 [Zalophus californianus]XP_027462031.1 immunity-related GTPase family M protein 1-like isoform X1 [Zalophus californianus]
MTQPALSLHTVLPTPFTSAVPYHKSWNILSKPGAMNIEKALEERKLVKVVSAVRETLKTASSAPVSIAVTGNSGNGMSSFINALRGIGHGEKDAAPTGVVRTTQIPIHYSFSHFPNVELWDLPGTGATTQSLETYLEEMQFSKYDLFIIIASEQFSMNLVKLAKVIQGQGKKFYIVWTKLDRDLSTHVVSKEQLLQNIQENIQVILQNEGMCEPIIFLVSSFDPSLHDFPELRKTLHRDVCEIRYHALLENLSDTCEKVINDKAITLQRQMGSESFQDTFGIQNADHLGKCLNVYHSLFGVDDESLQEVAQSMGKPMEEYKTIMKSQDLHTVLTGDWALSWMNCNTASYLYSVLSYIPILGNTSIQYLRGWNQRRLLDIVVEDTKTILKKILKDAII